MHFVDNRCACECAQCFSYKAKMCLHRNLSMSLRVQHRWNYNKKKTILKKFIMLHLTDAYFLFSHSPISFQFLFSVLHSAAGDYGGHVLFGYCNCLCDACLSIDCDYGNG